MDSRTNSCSQFNEVAYAETCLNKPLMLGSELKPHHSSQLLAYASYMTIFWAIKEGLGEEGKYPTPPHPSSLFVLSSQPSCFFRTGNAHYTGEVTSVFWQLASSCIRILCISLAWTLLFGVVVWQQRRATCRQNRLAVLSNHSSCTAFYFLEEHSH